MMQPSASVRWLRAAGGLRLKPPPGRLGVAPSARTRSFAAGAAADGGGVALPPLPIRRHVRRPLSSATGSGSDRTTTSERRRRSILVASLERVHDEGWTADAVASGTLDAGFPPSYVGRASSSTSPFGSADLVAFFMDECNAALKKDLIEERMGEKTEEIGVGPGCVTVESVSSRVNRALRTRLSMVLPYVARGRWHEGMAIGALPQNAYQTSQQLDEMAAIALDYALGEGKSNVAQRAAVVAAYAASELHLLSDGKDGALGGDLPSSRGERYCATWAFLEARSADAARFIVDEGDAPSLAGLRLPDPTHVAAASAVASSLAGAALSLAAPSAAAIAGRMIPRAMSMLTPLQTAVGSLDASEIVRDGTRPSDYAVETEALPPFDTSEEIFPENKTSRA